MSDKNLQDRLNILMVDDQRGKLLSYSVILEALGENLLAANSGREALELLLKHEVAIILIDVFMPEIDGFELARLIREHPRFERTAIIFISAVHITDLDRLRGYELGAVDYLPVPVVPDLLRAKVRVFCELYRKTRDLKKLNRELDRRVSERTAELTSVATMLRRSAEAARFANFEIVEDEIRVSDNLRPIWGLRPDEPCTVENLLVRVHPDDRAGLAECRRKAAVGGGPYEVEFRVSRPDGTICWLQERGEGEHDSEKLCVRIVGVNLDVTERKIAEDRQIMLMREVDHRCNNVLAVVQSVIRLSQVDHPADLAVVVEGRVAALARAHTLLAHDRWTGASVQTIIQEELAAYGGGGRIYFSGPSVRLVTSAVQPFAMVIHELTTNAAKYGALSSALGTVSVSWHVGAHVKGMHVKWIERGGPAISSAPSRRGFGTTLIEANLKDALGGYANVEWARDGLRHEMFLPVELLEWPVVAPPALVPQSQSNEPVKDESSHYDFSILNGLRVLLVEDEPLVAMEITKTLSQLGCFVYGAASNVPDGLAMANDHSQQYDAAVLDLNLKGKLSTPVAEALAQRGVPVVWITGYSEVPVMPTKRLISVIVRKPFASGALGAGLCQVYRERQAALL